MIRMDYRLTQDDKERVMLLANVRDHGLKSLDISQLERLRQLVAAKDYSHDRKAEKSKKKLINKINVAIYEKAEGREGI